MTSAPNSRGPNADEYLEIGSGVSVRLVYHGDELHGLDYKHKCADGHVRIGWVPVKPMWPDGWDVVRLDPLELSPSLACRGCNLHGFIRAGRWETTGP